MTDSWKNDNCAAVKARYALYSVAHAAALWCGISDDLIEQVLKEASPVSETGLGRCIVSHPDATCIEPRCQAIAEAIESGLLPHYRENGKLVDTGEHAAYERWHVSGRALKIWIEEEFPNDKPAFLFDDIERNSHSSINADAYRTLKADHYALKIRVDNADEDLKSLRLEKETIESDRNALQLIIDKRDDLNKSLSTKARHTMLVIIAALCKEANIDYSQRGVANTIQYLTENIGSPVTDDTIRSVLKQINEAVDVRSK